MRMNVFLQYLIAGICGVVAGSQKTSGIVSIVSFVETFSKIHNLRVAYCKLKGNSIKVE